MRILVIGGGGREHALVWHLSIMNKDAEIFCAPGNAGIAEIASCVNIPTSNIIELADFAQSLSIDLTVVGPELPLSLGIVNEFQKRHLPIFGPTLAAAQIECSKAWAKEFFIKYNIPTAKFAITYNKDDSLKKIRQNNWSFPIVLKVDGLAAGKGSVIVYDEKELNEFLDDVFINKRFGIAGEKIVIEEFLIGKEVSFQVVSDGIRMMPLVSAQDYKRKLDDNKGPNTGGMGSYSPSVFLNHEITHTIINSIIIPTIQGLANEGREYKGLLYAGIILTKDGPKLLEYNARFGDPETQAILPRLQSNCLDCFQAAIEGRLKDVKLEWKKDPCICVVLASRGYPDTYETDKEIIGLNEIKNLPSIIVFHAGTKKINDKLLTNGGRVLSITATAPSLSVAYQKVYEAVNKINFEGMQFRKDIASDAIDYLKKFN